MQDNNETKSPGLQFKKNVKTEFFKGTITYEMLSYEARIAKAQEVFVGVTEEEMTNDDGEGTGKTKSVLTDKQLDIGKKYGEIAKQQVKAVDLTCVSEDEDLNGLAVTSLDQLYCFQEGAEVINELVNTILGGHRLGKKPEKS